MALNPLNYTEKVVKSFLRYQLSAYPFADERMNGQLRELLSLEKARETPLLKGPYVSLSRAFRAGARIETLIAEGVLHEHTKRIIPYASVYGHQEEGIRAIAGGRTTLISTGTGSGKSECFLYPIISRCLELRDEGAGAGIRAVIVYPMNALAEDQLGRLRELLAGSGISFGMYIGKTPEWEADVVGARLPTGSSRADYRARLRAAREAGEGLSIHPPEEACSRETMREAGKQPRILLTNVKQLELLLTRQKDAQLFDNARLDFLVFDEAHTFTGAGGAETACLIRRLRNFCGRGPEETVCVATSATIVDERDPEAARDFASRFFGVRREAVATVGEIYEKEVWAEHRTLPPAPDDPAGLLEAVRKAVDADNPEAAIRGALRHLPGLNLPEGRWEETLHEALAANELLFLISGFLERSMALTELREALKGKIERDTTEEEIIAWLILGAAARKEDRPLVRPVAHGFLRGVPGAVVTFENGSSQPILHLSAGEEEEDEAAERRLRMRVSACRTCGQHYFENSLADFKYTAPEPGGGNAAKGGGVYWEPLEIAQGGIRVLFLDRLISAEDDDVPEGHSRLTPLHLCRACGAAHDSEGERCLACGERGTLLLLYAVRQKEKQIGKLPTCVCCGSVGRRFAGRFREPAKPVRATNVADVHVLAQDMIHHAERQRLLVFADNRQDAAFQAGWMRDHARRFRLRTLMANAIEKRPLSIGDLVFALDRIFEADDALSMALLPEVWAVATKEAGGREHQNERRTFLRIMVLLELTMAMKQQIGLEPWGRLKVNYLGLLESSPFIQKWAKALKLPSDELTGGIAAMLDQMRRKKLLFDRNGEIFSRFWMEGDRELQNGYLPYLTGVPKGVKFTRDPLDHKGRVEQWLSPGYQTTVTQIAAKWGVASEDTETFLRELWDYLTSPEVALLVPVTLKGNRGNALPNCHGSCQLDADKLLAARNASGSYRCKTCRRRTARRTPHSRCLAWRCDGELEHLPEDPDNYDLQLIDGDYAMLRPREHTAMVPTGEREQIEQIFKGESDAINTLVCTQTLELGVDIGALDAVLMRNVPPLPANYWQRAGRAGRRHRMAVNFTYCRPVNHDRAYFGEPLKLLGGRVDPPSFNLANGLMVAKHVHATIISRLHQLARAGSGLSASDREEIKETLREVFPSIIREYLFDERGEVRTEPLDVSGLHTVITKHRGVMQSTVVGVFQQGWPIEDADAVKPEKLDCHILGMKDELEAVVRRLHRRLRWALSQMEQLENLRRRIGALDEEQQSFYDRCRRFAQKMKGARKRRRRQAEGVDDIVTFSVLAAEGFLPGYGLESGSVLGIAEVPRWVRGLGDFYLPRVPSVALREYIPGNLIYSNGQRFVPRRYAREVGEEYQDAIEFEVNTEREAVREITGGVKGGATASVVTSIPICDVTLVHQSRISDEEDNRFQMGVSIYGRELGRHEGGQAFNWGRREVQLRKGMRLQLVNVGAPSVIKTRGRYGYPVCRACGQSISPFSSQRQHDDFVEKHKDWCQCTPEAVAFHADLAVDVLRLGGCAKRSEAYSMMEAIRFGAVEVLDMDIEDLQVLVIGRIETEEPDALLYDPMPGGSGLLEQICGRFSEVIEAATRIAEDCPGRCDASCIDCFQIYRNAFYHKHLDRRLMIDRFKKWGTNLKATHLIPPKQPARAPERDSQPVNVAERKLRRMLLAAGMPEGNWQERILLPKPLNATTPDVIFRDPDDDSRMICIYLDGLSAHIHGNPETRAMDIQIRAELRARDHVVLEITAVDLDDQRIMVRHLKRLARALIGRDGAREVAQSADQWFAAREDAEIRVDKRPEAGESDAIAAGKGLAIEKFPFEIIQPDPEERWKTCVPLYDLKVAAGVFGEGQTPEPEGWAKPATKRNLTDDMFIAQVVGKSMQPRIPDGSWCLFRKEVAGSRHGRILIVQHRDINDPDNGGSYTIKEYRRPPQDTTDGGDRGGRIILQPANPDYEPIVLEEELEDVRVIGELAAVL